MAEMIILMSLYYFIKDNCKHFQSNLHTFATES